MSPQEQMQGYTPVDPTQAELPVLCLCHPSPSSLLSLLKK